METESKEILTMRSMAWERAKGELRSMLHTFYSEARPGSLQGDRFARFDSLIAKFEDDIESEELHC